uniref:Uncharacterized protein n=1 Tax=Arundo donax TaxID=35708 RepID=A0A0A9B5K2_ARUDO
MEILGLGDFRAGGFVSLSLCRA